jgi:hypothetical protein
MDYAMTTEQIVKALETYAKWDTISSEFSHERHIAWKGAQEIRRLLAAQWGLEEANAKLKKDVQTYHDISTEYYTK